ncbi:MAG: hypothetical protein BGO55_00755 [Sphingobacteriales bacterium 50-39]|nr:hypothetical protein [Sphingobacteriales bacterium]OJW53645.1 MAG: hypothetical protein BGO55_00755 [Sphingobacteriales bacterium 50-39]
MAKISDAQFELPADYLTKNLRKGIRVTTCEQMLELAKKGESVWVSIWRSTKPSAFMVKWQADILVTFLRKNEVYTVIKHDHE